MTAAYLWMVVPAGLVGLVILAGVRMFRGELRAWFGQERESKRERGPREHLLDLRLRDDAQVPDL
jgi:hypothetical protein